MDTTVEEVVEVAPDAHALVLLVSTCGVLPGIETVHVESISNTVTFGRVVHLVDISTICFISNNYTSI